jgi:hypothetical protein
VGLRVRQRGQESPGLCGERVLAAVAGALQPPDLSVRVLLRQRLQHREDGGGADPGADQQHRCICLIEEEGPPWSGDLQLVANRQTRVQITAGDAVGFAFDGDPIVARPRRSRKGVIAQHRPLSLVGLHTQREVLTRARRR